MVRFFKERKVHLTRIVLAAAVLWTAHAGADDASAFKDKKEQESYAIGAQTGRTLTKDNVDIDADMLIRGLKDGLSGAKLLLTEPELRAVMSRVQQDVHKNMVLNRRALGERNKEEGARFLAENGRKEGVVTTSSGLQYRSVKSGSGVKPAMNSTVTLNYRGTLTNGFEFDASPKGKAAQIVVAQTVPGLREALQLMTVGSKWQIYVPSSLGYGDRGTGVDIGPDQVLLFDVELLGSSS